MAQWRIDDPGIPEDVQQEFSFLFNEVMVLTYQWQTFQTLFNHSERRVELINATAPGFFGLVQQNMLDQMVLILARLLDPEKSQKKKKNATFEHFTTTVEPHNKKLADELRTDREALKSEFAPFTTWRNRSIGHNDYRTAHKVELLPSIQWSQLANCIGLSQQWIEKPQRAYRPDCSHIWTVMEMQGADAIIAILKKTRALMEWERADWRNRNKVPRGSFDDA